MQIKQITANDINLVAPLFDAYRIFYSQQSNLQHATDFLLNRLKNNESIIFVAVDNGVGVGFCQLYPIFSSVSMRRTWLLNDLYVDEKFRCSGVATLLLEQTKQHAKQTDAKWLLLQTGKQNINAQKLYEKNGWQKVEDFFYEYTID